MPLVYNLFSLSSYLVIIQISMVNTMRSILILPFHQIGQDKYRFFIKTLVWSG